MTAAKTAEQPPLIYEAMAGVLADVGAIGKERRNQQQGFNFRGIDDAFNALHDVFAKHGVFCLPAKVLQRVGETRQTSGNKTMNVVHLHVQFAFYARDGSSVTAEAWGEAQDAGDKATGKAHSMAMKTALLEAFVVPTEGTPDPDGEAEVAAPPPQQARPVPGTAATAAEGIANGMPTPEAIDQIRAVADARRLVNAASTGYKAALRHVAERRFGSATGMQQLWNDEDLQRWTSAMLDACAQMTGNGQGAS